MSLLNNWLSVLSRASISCMLASTSVIWGFRSSRAASCLLCAAPGSRASWLGLMFRYVDAGVSWSSRVSCGTCDGPVCAVMIRSVTHVEFWHTIVISWVCMVFAPALVEGIARFTDWVDLLAVDSVAWVDFGVVVCSGGLLLLLAAWL